LIQQRRYCGIGLLGFWEDAELAFCDWDEATDDAGSAETASIRF
jgi:hypothetical protein